MKRYSLTEKTILSYFKFHGAEQMLCAVMKGEIMIFAHINNTEKESLAQHIENTFEYAKKYFSLLKKMIDDIFNNLNERQRDFIYKAAIDVIVMHDDGKKSPYFQNIKMNNKEFSRYKNHTANHSIIGSILYLYKYIKELDKLNPEDYSYDIEKLIWYFSFLISRHHSYLNDFSIGKNGDFTDSIKPYLKEESFFVNTGYSLKDIQETINIEDPYILGVTSKLPPDVYVLCKILYTIMCYSDFMATSHFMNNVNLSNREDVSKLVKKYNDQEFIKTIRNGEAGTEINKIRNDIFNEAEKIFIENKDKTFFYLSAPCGSGKTNVLSNLMFQSFDRCGTKRGVFCFPLNTLIDQTKTIFDKYLDFGSDYIVKNSITGIDINEDESVDYDKMWMDYQFLNYPLLITSHVSLFNILFGCGKSDCMCLLQLVDSIVVLDEIQQYKCSLWKNLVKGLELYAKLLNIKIIFSSATLPRLGLFLDSNDEFCELLKEDYSHCPVFKDRVNYDFSLFNSTNVLEDIKNIIRENQDKKVLIEFINKKDAKDFYYEVKSEYKNVELITGDTSKVEKRRIIDRSKDEKIILIGTQAIEAGCDIDFEIGLKDISIFDSEIQFEGRIARQGLYKGLIYFFDFKDAKGIYKKDVRTDYSILDEEIRKYFKNREFESFYNKIIERLSFRDSLGDIYLECSNLAFQRVNEMMKLIDEHIITIFLLSDSSEKVLNDIKQIICCSDLSYGEKNVKLLSLREKADDFTINISAKKLLEYDELKDTNILGMKVVRDKQEGDVFL